MRTAQQIAEARLAYDNVSFVKRTEQLRANVALNVELVRLLLALKAAR